MLKTCLMSVLFLPVLLASQTTRAEDPPAIELLNAGFNDAWFNPDTSGQGYFITVFPDLGFVSLAWFTYDTELPPEDATSNLGDPGNRWFTALGALDGNQSTMNIDMTSGGIFNAATEIEHTDPPGSDGTIVLTFDNCEAGTVEYNIPSINRQGTVPIQRVANDNVELCEALAGFPSCSRAETDPSHGVDNPPIVDDTAIPPDEIIGGGPGPDGIPALEIPTFVEDTNAANLDPFEFVIGVKIGDDIRAYPHSIMNWHEVANDRFTDNSSTLDATLSYCPLTGTAMLWKGFMASADKTYGTSGLLYNSNLIMYDRETESLWAQMLERGIFGDEILTIPERIQVVETNWGTWRTMYPETTVLSRSTGFSRNYDDYPYGSYRTNPGLLFPVNNINDNRLHRKDRVVGINVGNSSKVYPIKNFTKAIETLNETVGDMQVVVVGSNYAGLNLGVVFNRELADCTLLDFTPVQGKLPVVMQDNEGNEWDAFGVAVSGARTGQQLQKTNSYTSYWFAWTAFFPGADIHQ